MLTSYNSRDKARVKEKVKNIAVTNSDKGHDDELACGGALPQLSRPSVDENQGVSNVGCERQLSMEDYIRVSI